MKTFSYKKGVPGFRFAGVGIAAVDQNRLGYARFQALLTDEHRRGLDDVSRECRRGRARPVGKDEADVLFAVLFKSAGNS